MRVETLKTTMHEYFKKHPIDDLAEDKYRDVRRKYKVSLKTASKYWVDFKKRNNIITAQPDNGNYIKGYTNESLNINATVDYEIKSIDDLMKACSVDESIYNVHTWEVRKWDAKGVDNVFKTMFTVKAQFRPKKIENNLDLQKEIILKELYVESKKSNITYDEKKSYSKKTMLELALFDVHFGKFASKEESGEDYNLDIACKRWNDAINALLSRIDLTSVERILLPLGNDLINIDNFRGQTTAGTPQDSDTRFHNIIRRTRDTILNTINMLENIAPVTVLMVTGNHDSQTTFLLGDIIDAYYHNNKNITVLNAPSLRKYFKYGECSLMFTHGDKERFNDLGMIFAAENPQLWASTTQRYIQIGHLHHNKLQTVMKQDLQGFQVQILPSLCPNDAWHAGKGYISLRQAKAFLYDPLEGLVGEFTYTV